MMRRLWLFVLLMGAFCFLGTGIASAQYNEYQVKITDQQRRIDQGIASGQLTRNEASVLQDNLDVVKIKLARFRADGRLSHRERAEIDVLLDKNSMMISKKRHNIASLYDADFQGRIAAQQRRIDQGIASGALTRNEIAIIQNNLNWIKARYAKIKSDGMLTRSEWEKLDRMLDENDRMLYKSKRNAVRRLY